MAQGSISHFKFPLKLFASFVLQFSITRDLWHQIRGNYWTRWCSAIQKQIYFQLGFYYFNTKCRNHITLVKNVSTWILRVCGQNVLVALGIGWCVAYCYTKVPSKRQILMPAATGRRWTPWCFESTHASPHISPCSPGATYLDPK